MTIGTGGLLKGGGDGDGDAIADLAKALRLLGVTGEHFSHVLARQLKLAPSDLVAIGHLATDGPLTPRDLATRMEMTSGTMTALLDRVERAGFLERNSNPDDRRSLLISVTPAGQDAIRWVEQHVDAALREGLGATPEPVVSALVAVLNELASALEARAQSESPLHTSAT
jgi:DNA-binding MarR family transcriptional regulator